MSENREVWVEADDARVYGVIPNPAVLGRLYSLVDMAGASETITQALNMKRIGKPRGGVSEAPPLLVPARSKAAMAAAGLGTLAANAAMIYAPDAYNAAEAYLNRSGTSVEELSKSVAVASQTALADTLGRFGFNLNQVEAGDLVPKEAEILAQLIQKYRDSASASYAEDQSAGQSTGSPELDRIAINLDIETVCKGLAISSHLYAVLLRCINTHTPQDVEAFQLHRSAYGMRAI